MFIQKEKETKKENKTKQTNKQTKTEKPKKNKQFLQMKTQKNIVMEKAISHSSIYRLSVVQLLSNCP